MVFSCDSHQAVLRMVPESGILMSFDSSKFDYNQFLISEKAEPERSLSQVPVSCFRFGDILNFRISEFQNLNNYSRNLLLVEELPRVRVNFKI